MVDAILQKWYNWLQNIPVSNIAVRQYTSTSTWNTTLGLYNRIHIWLNLVHSNKNRMFRSFKSKENIHRKKMGQTVQFRIINSRQ